MVVTWINFKIAVEMDNFSNDVTPTIASGEIVYISYKQNNLPFVNVQI